MIPLHVRKPFSFKFEHFLDDDGSFRDDPLSPYLMPEPLKDEFGNKIPVGFKESGTNSKCG
jgi:hypothetical protein